MRRSFEYGLAFTLFMAGRYDAAITAAERALTNKHNHPIALEVVAMSHALSDRIEAAQQAMEKLRAVCPDMRISNRINTMAPFLQPDVIARICQGLRLAGLLE